MHWLIKWAAAVVVVAILPMVTAWPSAAEASEPVASAMPTASVVLDPSPPPIDGQRSLAPSPPPPAANLQAPAGAGLHVTYTGFTPEAEAAFQYAADVVGTFIASPVPIEVKASFTDLGEPTVLGSAGPAIGFAKQAAFPFLPVANGVYPVALGSMLKGSDMCPPTNTPDYCQLGNPPVTVTHDINARFNNSFTKWYFGTDGAPAGKIDFVTVVLHELLHGLGVVASFSVGGSGGMHTTPPTLYDTFVENGAGQKLVNTAVFPNPSSALGTQLTSGALRWSGASGTAGNLGVPPKLYAPSPFEPGSSIAHLDEATFPTGSPNDLMTPIVSTGQTSHDPGPILRGVLDDLGWNIAPLTSQPGYTAVTPVRICDTRAQSSFVPANPCNGNGTTTGRLDEGGSRNITVTGVGGVPASGVSAIAVNIAVTNTTASSHLTVWPADKPKPNASNLNWVGGQTVPGLVIVPVSPTGEISVFNIFGFADVIVDVQGYVSVVPAGQGRFNPLTPARICDTRGQSSFVPANPCNGDGTAPGTLGVGGTRTIQVTGQGGVPASGVAAVVANVSVTSTTDGSHLTIWPNGAAQPNAANLNWAPGDTVGNRVIIPVGTGGQIKVRNLAGFADVIVDVNGWITNGADPAAKGGFYNALSPTRICDSRAVQVGVVANQCNGNGAGPAPIQANTAKTIKITGGVVPVYATAVVLSVASTGSPGGGHFTIFPTGSALPNTADLNWVAGQTKPNLVVVRLPASGNLDVFSAVSGAHVVIDVEGYFTN
jgi:hypothetical protein